MEEDRREREPESLLQRTPDTFNLFNYATTAREGDTCLSSLCPVLNAVSSLKTSKMDHFGFRSKMPRTEVQNGFPRRFKIIQ